MIKRYYRVTRNGIKERTRMEVSKKILLYCDIQLSIVVATTFVAAFLGKEVDSLAQLDIALIALSTAAHSFYYWKAKAENLKKFNMTEDAVESIDEETIN